MGINIYNFKDVEWGPDEAKGDKNLSKYFLKIPEYNGLVNGVYRYVVGRKGTGKTAIIERIIEDVNNNSLWFETSLSLRDFPLTLIRDLRDKSCKDKSQFVPVWKFLILVEICKFVATDHGAGPYKDVLDLREFLKLNFPSDFTIADTLTYLREQDSKVSLSTKILGLSTSEKQSLQRVESIHYQKATQIIQKKLLNIETGSTYYLFFDELDEGYRAGDPSLRLLLLSLLRSIEDTFLVFSGQGLTIRPILALRSDIFDSLEDNDLNKLDDYIVRLNWSAEKEEGDYSLKALVNERIKASIPEIGSNSWNTLVDNFDKDLPRKVKSAWRYIANDTFERPRDIVKFLKLAGKESKAGILKFNDVLYAESGYSKWFYNELRDEIYTYLPIWKEALQVINKVGKGIFEKSELEEALTQDEKVAAYLQNNNLHVDTIIEKLFDFSVLGNLDDRGRWLFKYKDYDLSWDKNMKLILHFGFFRKLRIRKW